MAGRRPAGMYASFAYVRTGETAFDLRTYVSPPASLRWRARPAAGALWFSKLTKSRPVSPADCVAYCWIGFRLHFLAIFLSTTYNILLSHSCILLPPFSFVLFDGYLFIYIYNIDRKLRKRLAGPGRTNLFSSRFLTRLRCFV